MVTQPCSENHDYNFKIVRWDVVLAANGLNKRPVIYILPDNAFLDFVSVNNHTVTVEIYGTNNEYDGMKIKGLVSSSKLMPNFHEKTGLSIVSLDCDWYGYPLPVFSGNALFTPYNN